MPKTPRELDLPIRPFKSQASWEKWLGANHVKSSGIWMQIAKKASGISSVSYQEALDVALCYGWIDGQKRPYDDAFWLQRFTPRGPRSLWSKINTGKADGLIRTGRMQPAGLAAIQAAKADGRWESAYAPSSTTEVPPELAAALDAHPNAKAFFETLRGANRYAVLFRLQTAKKPETRAKRVADFIERFERGETVYDRQKALAAAKKKAKTRKSS
jgi:uncharacterized protein YdeI (YjbR/CyaY-like superfamily)